MTSWELRWKSWAPHWKIQLLFLPKPMDLSTIWSTILPPTVIHPSLYPSFAFYSEKFPQTVSNGMVFLLWKRVGGGSKAMLCSWKRWKWAVCSREDSMWEEKHNFVLGSSSHQWSSEYDYCCQSFQWFGPQHASKHCWCY